MSCRVCIRLYWSCRRILNCPELLDIFCSPGTGPAVILRVETLLSASGGMLNPVSVTLCVWPEAIVAIVPDCLSGFPPGSLNSAVTATSSAVTSPWFWTLTSNARPTVAGMSTVPALVSVMSPGWAITLTKAGTVDIPATVGLAFDVKVQNQGDVTEENVAVTAEFKLPGGNPLKQSGTIATIASGQTQSVTLTGFNIPPEALSKVSTLKITAGPVPGEQKMSNNSGQFKILLQLQ